MEARAATLMSCTSLPDSTMKRMGCLATCSRCSPMEALSTRDDGLGPAPLWAGPYPLSTTLLVTELPLARLYSCAPTDDVDDALRIMRRALVRRLPVVDEDEMLVGIISMDDLALHVKEPDGTKNGLTAQKVAEALKAICSPRKPKHRIRNR